MQVTMHFGDGTFKLIDVEADDPDEAVSEAREWVAGNAWFQVESEEGDVMAEEKLT